MDPQIAAFIGVAALLTVSPGPDMALVTRNVLRGGQPVVVPSALGVAAGCIAWGVGSSLGIAALVAASAEAYTALRLVGAAYLAILGLLALRAAVGAEPADAADASDADAAEATDAAPTGPAGLTRAAAFRVGLVNNLVNPKVGIFYATFLPQFVPAGAPVFATSVLLATIHAGLGVVWLTLFGTAVGRAGHRLRTGKARRALEAVTGIVLVGFGLRIAVER